MTTESKIRGEIEGDWTKIQIDDELAHKYKLRQAYTKIRNLEFHTDLDITQETFAQYKATMPITPEEAPEPQFEEKQRPHFPDDEAYRDIQEAFLYPKGIMLVLVDESIYDAVSSSINQYVLDVGRDGYWATIHVVQNADPASVRNYIITHNPVGILLVGAIPVPWFELEHDFHGRAEFPCDLYYMDTNGNWSDPDGDGKFSDHDGNINPEIWVGRIWSPTENGNDSKLINDYFARNHKFRIGELGYARSALAYPDDDWESFDDCALDEQFPASLITKYTSPT